MTQSMNDSLPLRACKKFALPFFAAILFNWSAAARPVTISVNTSQPGARIPQNALGLSYETSLMLPDAHGVHYFRPDNRCDEHVT